jgi:hypothetical protein
MGKSGIKPRTLTKYVIGLLMLMLLGCASQPVNVHSESTTELLDRRAEINRKLKEDDLGVAWGMTRWISHAAEKDSVLKERAAIDAELERRHVKPRDLTASQT